MCVKSLSIFVNVIKFNVIKLLQTSFHLLSSCHNATNCLSPNLKEFCRVAQPINFLFFYECLLSLWSDGWKFELSADGSRDTKTDGVATLGRRLILISCQEVYTEISDRYELHAALWSLRELYRGKVFDIYINFSSDNIFYVRRYKINKRKLNFKICEEKGTA
jgi:hypothetical protein